MKQSSNEAERRCLCCGKRLITEKKSRLCEDETLGIKDFSTYHRFYSSMPWCRSCVGEMANHFSNTYQERRVAFLYLCRMLDYPFIARVVSSYEELPPDEAFFSYLTETKRNHLARVKQGFLGGDYIRESDLPILVEAEIVDSPIEFTSSKKDAENCYVKWGRNTNYRPEDYADLEDIYQRIVKQNGIIVDEKTGEVADKVTELAVIEAACNLLESRKARNVHDADNAKKYYDLYDKAMASQLLRGKDVKDKQVGDVLVQDIVKYCEEESFIEPWDRKIKYPHKKDVVDQVLLHIMNYVGKLTADIFNKHVSKLDKLPKDYKLDTRNDTFATEETEFDKIFRKGLDDINDFKARQHLTDEEADEDSADLDDDNDSDAALLGEDGE